MEPIEVIEGVWMVAGPELTDPRDCCAYLVDLGVPVLIDTGAGDSYPAILEMIRSAGRDPMGVDTVILTHCHLDHIGAALRFREDSQARTVAHEGDAEAIEQGDPDRTAATWYRVSCPRTPVDLRLTGDQEIPFPRGSLLCYHTPGHTPGSLSVLLVKEGRRVLFGQDIHGPFSPQFGSDIQAWSLSMERLLAAQPDVLCEGHYGIYEPADAAREFIEGFLNRYRGR